MEDYKVIITRHPQDYRGGEISISEISSPHWDNCSGGIRKKQSGYSLYGYIAYKLAHKIVKCSGSHIEYGNDAKICIPASANKDEIHKMGYQILLKSAGEKPKRETSLRPKGAPPCTKRILQVVSENESITRGDLKSWLNKEGYPIKTICNALKTLIRNQKVATEGSSYSPNQKLKISK
ncbi:hypothetical protein [Blautia producta]|uniref:hypothetical protein n=1 Tax=Blautia producta TaxID=33035 RepID=UPI0031B5C089